MAKPQLSAEYVEQMITEMHDALCDVLQKKCDAFAQKHGQDEEIGGYFVAISVAAVKRFSRQLPSIDRVGLNMADIVADIQKQTGFPLLSVIVDAESDYS